MKTPLKGKTELYDISDTELAAVKLEESGQFWVTIVNRENPGLNVESPFDNNSNVIFLSTFEEVKDHLLERAAETYKDQFRE